MVVSQAVDFPSRVGLRTGAEPQEGLLCSRFPCTALFPQAWRPGEITVAIYLSRTSDDSDTIFQSRVSIFFITTFLVGMVLLVQLKEPETPTKAKVGLEAQTTVEARAHGVPIGQAQSS